MSKIRNNRSDVYTTREREKKTNGKIIEKNLSLRVVGTRRMFTRAVTRDNHNNNDNNNCLCSRKYPLDVFPAALLPSFSSYSLPDHVLHHSSPHSRVPRNSNKNFFKQCCQLFERVRH